jgi:hypothetical protein
MTSLKGHFNGSAIVLDEPATLMVGQHVRVVIEDAADREAPRPSLRGIAKGTFTMQDGFNKPLDEFEEYLR